MAGPVAARRLALLGATGSIGGSTLDVVARHPDRFEVDALSAHHDVSKLVALCRRFRPRVAVVSDPARYAELRDGLTAAGLATEARAGAEALDEIAADPGNDTVVAAIVGAAGMASTLAAARAGKRLLLANKESVVLAGELLARAAAEGGATVLPVDSEHNAIFQCLPADGGRCGVRRLLLTASGGPFRGRDRASLATVTPDQACAHPRWVMGRKISVDSATLMNKGLEVIEAHFLFGVEADRIEVLVHPQSIVHSLVDYVDGSMLAQLGNPDMRTALAYGLGWPQRLEAGSRRWTWRRWAGWTSRRRTARPSPAWGWPTRRWRPAAAPLPYSTPPTRSRSPHSWRDGCPSWAFPPWWRPRWIRCRRNLPATWRSYGRAMTGQGAGRPN